MTVEYMKLWLTNSQCKLDLRNINDKTCFIMVRLVFCAKFYFDQDSQA